MTGSARRKIEFIYWFAYYNLDSPSVRYRGKYPLEFLKSQYKVGYFFIIPGYRPVEILRFLRAYFSALLFRKSNSLIVVQRIHSSFIYSTLLKFLIWVRPSHTFYDLDDADYLDYPPGTIYHFIHHCSGVFVGSRELVKNLSRLNSNILLNTSPVPDLQIYKAARRSILTVGWIGDFADGHKEAMMNLFFPALRDLDFRIRLILLGVGRKSDSDFHFLSDYFRNVANIQLDMPRNIDWNNERELQERISEFDVGIAALLDNETHRSKSAFKLKQYLNSGVPVLSSDLPENNFFIRDGQNGFLCNAPADFRRRLIEINNMSGDAYMRLSIQARQSIHYFSLHAYCENLMTLNGQSPEGKSSADLGRTVRSTGRQMHA